LFVAIEGPPSNEVRIRHITHLGFDVIVQDFGPIAFAERHGHGADLDDRTER
jgi:hypothetical protein